MKPLQDYRNLDSLIDLQEQLKSAEQERSQAHGQRSLSHKLDRLIMHIKQRIKKMEPRSK